MKIHFQEIPNRSFFGNVDLELKEGQKILLFGANGIGKTTFLRNLCFRENSKNFYSSYETTNSYLPTWEALSLILPGGFEDHFGIKYLGDQPLKALSSGQLQQCWLTIAFNSSSELLCFDEPTVYLDYGARQKYLQLIRHEKRPMLIVSHELEFFSDTTTHILSLEKGSTRLFEMKEFPKPAIN
jgi:ATPase subunit of ABC transporter with duplicated ATPase domains